MNEYMKVQIKRAKLIYKQLLKMYPDIKKIPLEFVNLKGKSGGYLETYKIGNKNIPIQIVLDNSGLYSTDPDYVICHEFAHLILCIRKNNLAHSKVHSNLTNKLANKFNCNSSEK